MNALTCDNTWIGMRRIGGQFTKWENGDQNLDYTNWKDSQPDKTDEECAVQLTNG